MFFATHASASAAVPALQHDTPLSEYLKAFGVGLVAVSFTYGGYQQTINFGEEVYNPKRNIPRGIFLGIAIIIILYLSINYAYVKVIGFNELKNSKNIAAIMASKMFGINARTDFIGIAFFKCSGLCKCIINEQPACNGSYE